MRSSVGDKVRLQHINDAIIEVEEYTRNVDFSDFSESSMRKYACIKQLEIIGEASNTISNELKLKFPEVNWVQIVSLRNVLVHEYFGIDSKLIWDIIKNDLPQLKKEIGKIIHFLS